MATLDLRAAATPATLFDLNVTRYGVPTSLLLDARDAAWLLVGTSRGRLALYDRRSTLPLWTRVHPLAAPLRRLRAYHGDALRSRNGAPAALYACADGVVEALELSTGRVVLALAPNGPLPPARIVGTLKIDSGERLGSAAVAFESSESTAAFASFDDHVITSDAAFGLDVWSVRAPLVHSRTAVRGSTTAAAVCQTRFLQAGPHTYYKEVVEIAQPANPHNRSNPHSPQTPVGNQHHDLIGDVAVIGGSSGLLVTAARDGVIKVWK